MGQVLSAPITTKESGDGCAKPKDLAWGCSCMQGWRVQMEDTHFALSELPGDGWEETAAFCVMDGHGGKEVARFCERHLPGEIANGSSADPSAALVTAFHRMDEMLGDASQSGDLRVYSYGSLLKTLGMEAPAVNPDWVGCTCVCCLVRADAIVVAKCGDSRAVLSRCKRAVPLSEEHRTLGRGLMSMGPVHWRHLFKCCCCTVSFCPKSAVVC